MTERDERTPMFDNGNPYRIGDKVFDIRDGRQTLWRVKAIVAEADTERMTLGRVEPPHDEICLLARDLLPYLRRPAWRPM